MSYYQNILHYCSWSPPWFQDAGGTLTVSRCKLLDLDPWRTEVIVVHRQMIPQFPSWGARVEVGQDWGQAFCLRHQFPEHIEGLHAWTSAEQWGHGVLCRCKCVHLPLTLSVHTRRQDTWGRSGFVLQQGWSRLADFMLLSFMLYFFVREKSRVLPCSFCSPVQLLKFLSPFLQLTCKLLVRYHLFSTFQQLGHLKRFMRNRKASKLKFEVKWSETYSSKSFNSIK